ncbi:hypothetical protein B7463_g4735, partial [Scytalidium lignicola]
MLLGRSRSNQASPTLLEDKENGFGFFRSNLRPNKPRKDLVETMGHHADGLKFAGGSFSLIPARAAREMIDIAHENKIYVSTGRFMEHILLHLEVFTMVDRYLQKCKDLGFDVVELSSSFLSFPPDDWLRLTERVQSYNLKPKPELGIQFGAGGDTEASALEASDTSNPGKLINLGQKFIDMGVERMMIKSEGITENVKSWRADVIQDTLKGLPVEKIMFEADKPRVFSCIPEFDYSDMNLNSKNQVLDDQF